MWVIVLFDLPVDTPEARRHYTRFRKSLLKDGFLMMQFSVYARSCPSEENAQVHDRRVKSLLPPAGEVRVLHLTDAQMSRMKIFRGRKRQEPEQPARQLEFF
jgi:CRISPR-associated protein Cas2